MLVRDDMGEPVMHREPSGRVCDTLNDLIRTGRANAILLEVAASVSREPAERRRFLEMSRTCAAHSRELADVVLALGGTPVEHRSVVAKVQAAIARADAVVKGVREQEAYGVCAAMLAASESEYERALAGGLPGVAEAVIARQHLEVGRDRATVRRLWNLP